ncbi:hypothetical protein [Duganella vulcania]|uniref:Uncharacterized protein n=1 Tax=Duganella vulcania TaxID=2692166 RepID=A0A845GE74_9BURK|nr:hypothetical protein [Duganella vulcania]MYM92594.1 hypothetical protein [Duganella vulcania]
MLWMITQDIINAGDCANWVGRCGAAMARDLGAARVPEDERAQLVADCDYEFRLYDGDDHLYYEGVCKELDQQDGESAFEPLDWAQTDAGCTTMKYRKKGLGVWQTL